MEDFLIIGGGLSGLILAYFLQKNNFNCKIIERDPSICGKRQGFSLTLQHRTKDILEEYGLLDEILSHGSPVNTQIFYSNTGEILYKNENQDQKRFNYPLPRQEIRNTFYNQLKKGTVIWNKYVTNILVGEEYTEVVCSDDSIFQCKVLFACDGLHSKVRQFVTDQMIVLDDFNLMNIYGLMEFNQLGENKNNVLNFFKNKEVQVLDGHHRFFSKPFNDHFQMWELTYPLTDNDDDGKYIYNVLNSKQDPRHQALQKVNQIVHEWNLPELHKFIETSDVDRIIVHPLYDHLPTYDEVKNLAKKKILLIGDSIHPMSPFIGMGANQAIVDAYEVVELLKAGKGSLEEIIDQYYKEMIYRTRISVMRSRDNTLFYHSPDAINRQKLYAFKGWKHKLLTKV